MQGSRSDRDACGVKMNGKPLSRVSSEESRAGIAVYNVGGTI
jgi:hypothetical protein